MKVIHNLLLLTAIICNISAHATTSVYSQELEGLKSSERYKTIFNEDSNIILRGIQRDVENFKNLTPWQRLIRFTFLGLNVIVVTPETMPVLYGYINDLCKAHEVVTPTVFITIKEKGFFNAMAQKLLMSTGAIVIGQQLISETADAELEGVIAHEIGHIKYNHVNKNLAILISSLVVTELLLNQCLPSISTNSKTHLADYIQRFYLTSIVSGIVTACIINKRFEKEADEFASKVAGHGQGLIEFFEHLETREQSYQSDFDITAQILTENKSKLELFDYLGLCMNYYLARFGNKINNTAKWIYHNTPLGAHPSPEARIEAVQAFLQQQNQENQ